MPLKVGTTLGPYEVLSAIGAGGMGEVYKARDTKLDRDVALKILPDAFVDDPERLARFQREAKVLASLNHPNIAAIYGLEESGDSPALVLEYVPGPTLQDRIAKGPIPLDEALPIARQIAEALEAAHEQGVIHRDLKPANVKVKDDGTVKVLDFGLAKALQPELSDLDAANSPTMTMTAAATKMGVIMGTAAYMSPEQARGKQVDKRADIWAFGVVLFEMLAGTAPFSGDDVTQTLARVVEREPDWNALPATVPPSLDTYLRRCLQKDLRQRVQAIGDVRLAMEGAFEATGGERQDPSETLVAAPALWQRPVFAAAALVLTAVVAGLAVWTLTRPAPTPPAPITRMSIVLPQTQQLTNRIQRSVAISPTGTHVVYVANEQLYLRPFDELRAQALSGTEATDPSVPFFSPDGQWIAFLSQGALKKVAVSGGAAVTLAEVSGVFGASWGADDTILFGQAGQGILRVAGAGGTPELLVPIERPNVGHQPQMLPGGEAVLYTLGTGGRQGAWDTAQIVVEQVASGDRTVLIEGGTDARYLPTGHLVYALGTTLLAAPFDVDRLELTGGPVPLVEGVSRAFFTGAANAAIARNGTLVYLQAGRARDTARTPVWVDRDGNEEAVGPPPGNYLYPRISPDGESVILDRRDDEDDVWVWDLTREALTRLTFTEASNRMGLWTPDGQRIIFSSTRDGAQNLYWRAADGTGPVERLTESPNIHWPMSFSPDGSRLVVWEAGSATGNDLLVLTLDEERRLDPLIVTEFSEMNAEISPDGQWLAYESDASGRTEVYVQPFPDVDTGRWPISTSGGQRPLWGPQGRELFYFTPGGVMGVTVETREGFTASPPTLIIEGSYFGPQQGLRGRTYDITPDGTRFLMLKEAAPADTDDPFAGLTQIHVVLNWFEELQARVPTGR